MNVVELPPFAPPEAYEERDLRANPAHAPETTWKAKRLWPAPIDLKAMLATAPAPPRMIIDDWLPCGYATLLAGHGGAGKSSIALHLAVNIATGGAFWGLNCSPRRVLYLSCEDRADVLHWRLSRICQHEGLDANELDALRILDLVGHDAILFRRDAMMGAHGTGALGELATLMTETASEVLIVDGVSDTYGGSENDRAEIKAYVNALVKLVGVNGAVVLIHHVSKPTASGGATTEGYSGSTGWHNSVRARWYLYPETERVDDGIERTGKLVLALQKSNLGKDDQSMRLRYDDDAHLFVAEASAKPADRHMRDEEEQFGIVQALREVIEAGDYVPAASQGSRTAYHVLSAAKSFPDTLKSPTSKRRFLRHIEVLRRERTLSESSMRRANRTHVATLVLSD